MTVTHAFHFLPSDPTRGRLAARERQVQSEARRLRARQRSTPRTGRFVVISTLIAMTLLVPVGIVPAPSAAALSADFAGAHGIYQLRSGELLTLFGRHPMLEVGGEEIHLVADGPDRYVSISQPLDSLRLHRDATGAAIGVTLNRPGEASAFAARVEPYVERQVTFASTDLELRGSMLLPVGAGPHPAVAIVHGAEFGTRETYRIIASHLARRGVATLIYDKRGTGASDGDFAGATFDDLTADALRAVALLRDQPEIDADRVGLAGMSQGGWIIAKAANQSRDIAFLIALSASGYTPAEQAAWLTGSMLAVRGFDQAAIDMSARAWAMMYSSLDLVEAGIIAPLSGVPGFWFHALDPDLDTAGLWEQVRQPVLGLWGELDCQVPARDSLAAIRAALDRGPNRTYELRILPGGDHGMALVAPCEREIGATHAGRVAYADGFLSRPAEWIHSLAPDVEARLVSIPPHPPATRLGWHQATDTSAPWFGSMATQLGLLALLLILFTATTLAVPVRRLGAPVSPPAPPGAGPSRQWIVVGVLGLVATLAGTAALAELLMLADLGSAPLLGGPSVDGVTTLSALAGALSLGTIALGALGVSHEVRAGRRRSTLTVLGSTSVLLLAAWAGYWGFIPLLMLA